MRFITFLTFEAKHSRTRHETEFVENSKTVNSFILLEKTKKNCKQTDIRTTV